jgi:hypothetical protein
MAPAIVQHAAERGRAVEYGSWLMDTEVLGRAAARRAASGSRTRSSA